VLKLMQWHKQGHEEKQAVLPPVDGAPQAQVKGHVPKNKLRMLVWILGLGAVCLVVGGVAVNHWWPSGKDPAADSVHASAEKATSFSTVRALARLEPEGGVIVLAGGPGTDRVKKVLVEEGAEVREDQELILLESQGARQAELNLARAQLGEARRRLDALTASGEAQVAEAEIGLREVKELLPIQLRADENLVNLLIRQLEAEKKNQARVASISRDVRSRQEEEAKERAVVLAEVDLVRARAALDKTRAGQDLNLEAAEARLRTAKTALERARNEVPIESLERSCQVAEEHLRASVLRTPTKGRILKMLTRAGEAAGPQPLLQMANTASMIARAEVYETDVVRVRPGQTVTVTSPALPDAGLRGVVTRVGQTVGRNRVFDLDPTADVDRRIVDVTIRLEPSEIAAMLINHQVRVAIDVGPQVAR
jgi:HlyD family secretion protein